MVIIPIWCSSKSQLSRPGMNVCLCLSLSSNVCHCHQLWLLVPPLRVLVQFTEYMHTFKRDTFLEMLLHLNPRHHCSSTFLTKVLKTSNFATTILSGHGIGLSQVSTTWTSDLGLIKSRWPTRPVNVKTSNGQDHYHHDELWRWQKEVEQRSFKKFDVHTSMPWDLWQKKTICSRKKWEKLFSRANFTDYRVGQKGKDFCSLTFNKKVDQPKEIIKL